MTQKINLWNINTLWSEVIELILRKPYELKFYGTGKK